MQRIGEKKLEQNLTGEVHVMWDYDSSTIPAYINADAAIKKLIELAQKHGRKINVQCFVTQHDDKTKKNIADEVWKALIDNKVQVHSVPMTQNNVPISQAVDKQIIAKMGYLTGKPPDTFILVTGDAGYHENLNDLAKSLWKVMVLYPDTSNEARFINKPFYTAQSFDDVIGLVRIPNAIEPLQSVCAHFTKNEPCPAGNNCHYLHLCSTCLADDHGAGYGNNKCRNYPEPKPNPIPYCGHFIRGHCKDGKECKNDHTCPFCGKPAENGCSSEQCKKYQTVSEKFKVSKSTRSKPESAPSLEPKKAAYPVIVPGRAPRCEEKFHCEKGINCTHFHMRAEFECFINNKGVGVPKYCTDICKHGEKCRRTFDCNYAHKESEYVCFFCAKKGDHIAKSCPDRNKYKSQSGLVPANNHHLLPAHLQKSKASLNSSFIAQSTDKTIMQFSSDVKDGTKNNSDKKSEVHKESALASLSILTTETTKMPLDEKKLDLLKNTLSEHVTLNGYSIKDSDIQNLLAALQQNFMLTSLDLSGTGLSDESIMMLAYPLRDLKLRELNFSSNRITDIAAKCLALALKKNQSLESLDLSNTEITQSGAAELLKSLKDNNQLMMLNFNNNPQIKEDFLKELLFEMDKRKKDKLENRDFKLILQQIYAGNYSKEVNLSGIKLSPQDIKNLVEVLVNSSPRTTILNLDNTLFNEAGINFLIENLIRKGQPHSLTTLSLKDNKITNEIANRIIENISDRTTLTRLDLSSNNIDDKLLQKINELIPVKQSQQPNKESKSQPTVFSQSAALFSQAASSPSKLAAPTVAKSQHNPKK